MPTESTASTETAPKRRQYKNDTRKQQAEQTRQRILAAGTGLLNHSPTWNWPAVTIRAVAAEAGVNERTVYRHFGSERELRDAVLDSLNAEIGIDLDRLRLEDIAEVSRHVFEYVASIREENSSLELDPTIVAVREDKRAALLKAVQPLTGQWSATDQAVAAAMLDMLWNVCSYRHVADDWGLAPADVSRGIIWLIRLAEQAIRDNRPPEP